MATVTDCIKQLVLEDYNNPWNFYRAIYKATPCGPTIGFKIAGQWIYNNDLPDDPESLLSATGVSVSSIVEGSDVEIEPVKFEEPFLLDHFWQSVKEVNDEAEFYWLRDNSQWYDILDENQKYVAMAKWTAFDDNPEFCDEPDLEPGDQEGILNAIRFMEDHDKEYTPYQTMAGKIYTVHVFENDTVYM